MDRKVRTTVELRVQGKVHQLESGKYIWTCRISIPGHPSDLNLHDGIAYDTREEAEVALKGAGKRAVEAISEVAKDTDSTMTVGNNQGKWPLEEVMK